MIDTLMFDFDGTIMNTNEVIIRSWQHAFKTLGFKPLPVKDLYKNFGEPIELTVQKYFPGVPVDDAVEVYRSYHRDNFGEMIKVFPGMREELGLAKKSGYKVGLVTSRTKKTLFQGLEAYELTEYFDDIVSIDDTTKHKPDPEPINIMLSKLDSLPEHSLMVGDTLFDILCAKNANVRSMLVGWSVAVNPETLPKEQRPDYILKEPVKLLEMIEA